MSRACLLGLAALACACSGGPTSPPDAGARWWTQGALADCAKLGGAAPASVAATVDRLNQLPRPVSVACFVASLPRPLSLVATRSITSAQPAKGVRSPRVFILSDTLVLSVVPEGVGARLLEFGEYVSALDTLKGELELPVTAALAPTAPYEGLLHTSGNLTRCALCHRNEAPHATIPGAFVSRAFRPEDVDAVSLAALRAELDACDVEAERERCELLAALLGFGAVQQGALPRALERFVQ